MNRNTCLLTFVLLAAGVAQAQDSLNCREKGSWPFGPSYAVALDPARNLAFWVQAAGCTCWTSQTRPSRRSCPRRFTRAAGPGPLLSGEPAVHCRGEAGLEIWDVTDPRLRQDSDTATRRGMPMAWRWRAATPTSPTGMRGLRIINVRQPGRAR